MNQLPIYHSNLKEDGNGKTNQDASCKSFLSCKYMLAVLLEDRLQAYQDMTMEEIITSIELDNPP